MISTSDPLAHMREPLIFEGIGPMKAVRRFCVAGYIVNPTRTCEAFPDVTVAHLNSMPEGYGVSTVRHISNGWTKLRSLILSIPYSEQLNALAMCEHMPCLQHLNTDGSRIVERLVDFWDEGEFVSPVDALAVSVLPAVEDAENNVNAGRPKPSAVEDAQICIADGCGNIKYRAVRPRRR